MHILFHVSLPSHFLTPGLTKERQASTVHSLRTYSIHVSGSFTLALHHHRFSHSFPGGCRVPKLSVIPALEMPPETQTHVRAKTRSKKISEQQWNYHESLPSSMSWVPTSLNLRVSFHDHTLSLESLQISVLSRTYCACWKCGMIGVAGAVTHIVEWWNARHGWDKE